MIKSLVSANKSEREKFTVPRSVQETIPVKCVYPDGIWLVGNRHSKSWRLTDVNYAAASDEERRGIFLAYGGVLNSLPTDAATKITIINRRLNPVDFERSILMEERWDGLDEYRQEANAILKRRAAESNNLVQEKYITLSIPQRKIEETRSYFRRVDGNLTKSLGRLDSTAREVANHDRLRILHDFFRPGEEQYFTFDQTAAIRHGVDFKDLVCPDGISFKAGHFEMGGKYGRVLFLKEYASYIEDDMISDLSDFDRSLMLSIDILPIPTDEAVKEIQSRILGIESDITRWQQRQNDRNNFTAAIPYELEQLRAETKEFLSDLTERDQRMIFAVVTLVHIADTLEQLDADTETLLSIGREHLCQFSVLRYQQEDGLNTVLPYGLRRVKALRTLTTESAAVLMPYRVQEIQDPGGLSYGINAISRNLLICDRKRLISPHGFYLGVSGSGKSMGMKDAITEVVLGTGDDVIIIDAEREYGPLAKALGGEIIEISPHSQHHISPLDLGSGYADDENPVAMKSEIITSILEQQMGAGRMSASHKSIIDRCTSNIYQNYFQGKGKVRMPLLTDWREEVLKQADPEAREIALAAELITEGIAGLLGGAFLIPIICLIVLVAAIIASPFGILFANEPTPGAMPLNVAVGQLNMELANTLETMQTGDYDSIDIQGQGPDWREVVAVFAARTAGADDGTDVAALTPDRVDRLKAVFWDMCAITATTEDIEHPAVGSTAAWTETVLHITITSKTAEDMRTQYAFTEQQNHALTELLAELSTMELLLTDLAASQEQARNVLQSLPADLVPERRAAVEKACQLVGKVNYFWGGKSYVIGWDSRWGTIQKVFSPGNSTTGTYRPFGLDCSGFVDWALRNAGLPSDGHWYINRNLTAVSQADALPGDLALYPDASHVGMVVGRNEAGKLLVCHCSSGQNNVVITEFTASGFTVVGRLAFMGG